MVRRHERGNYFSLLCLQIKLISSPDPGLLCVAATLYTLQARMLAHRRSMGRPRLKLKHNEPMYLKCYTLVIHELTFMSHVHSTYSMHVGTTYCKYGATALSIEQLSIEH